MKIKCSNCNGKGSLEQPSAFGDCLVECSKCHGDGKINESCYMTFPFEKVPEPGLYERQLSKIKNNIENSYYLLKSIQDMDIREIRGIKAIIYDLECLKSQIKAQLGEL